MIQPSTFSIVGYDPESESRQMGIVDASGNSAAHTGGNVSITLAI